MKIKSYEEYLAAKKRMAELFHANSCDTNYEESNALYEALQSYEDNNSIGSEESFL